MINGKLLLIIWMFVVKKVLNVLQILKMLNKHSVGQQVSMWIDWGEHYKLLFSNM